MKKYKKELKEISEYDSNKCFVCKCELNESNRTVEHIYPKWLQKEFDLKEKTVSLSNNTLIKYKKLTIPCCKKCNESYSIKIEQIIKQAVSKGYDEFIKIDRDIVFVWLNKLAYGLSYKEQSLKMELDSKEDIKIQSNDNYEIKLLPHLVLNSVNKDLTLFNKPYSLLIFKIKSRLNESDYYSSEIPSYNTFCIRMHDIGVICNLYDGGSIENDFHNNSQYNELLSHEICFIQFLELSAILTYRSSALVTAPYFTGSDSGTNTSFIITTNNHFEFKDWNNEIYYTFLDFYLKSAGYYINNMYEKNLNEVRTLIYDENGSYINDPYSLIRKYKD